MLLHLHIFQHPKYWMSLVWAGAIVTRAKKEGRIKDDFAFQTIITEINNFRSGCGGLLDYDWISIPLVYTQVVTLAVYSFFLSSLMGRQFLDITKGYEGHEVDLYVPIFTFLQFFFYMGWLKVAEVLINPFGEDDDDFEMNWLIDRNLQVAYLIVDEMHAEHPELVKDQYWDEGVPDELPYTVAAEEFRQADPWQGSTAEVEVPEEQSEFVYLDKIEEGSEDDEARTESDQENLKEIKIDHLTKPMVIGNGKLKSVRESVSSNLTSLGQRRNESSTSVMGLIRRVLQGPESGSNINVTGLGSAISINSKTGGGNTSKKSSRVRRKKSKPGCYRSISNASPLSHENLSQGMSRINTQEQAIFKMSDTSSVNSLNSESDFPSRSNSEATALREVRDILANDLDFERRKSNHDLEDERDFKAFKSPRQRKKDRSRKPEANVIKLRRRLEQVQALQSQIIKSIDAEIKETQSKDLELDANCDDVIQLLEQKAAELKKSRSRTSDMMEVDISPHESGALRRSRHPSFTTDMNFSSHVPDKIVRGSVSSPGPGPAPSSPVPKQDHEIGSDAKHKVFPILISTASDGSFANELFEMDSVREADDEEENDGSNEESEPQSVVENLLVPTTELIDANMSKKDENYYEESWDNLGTIEEQPELGYQSDSSDTELLATFDKDKKKTKNKSPDKSEPALPTVQEENQDLG